MIRKSYNFKFHLNIFCLSLIQMQITSDVDNPFRSSPIEASWQADTSQNTEHGIFISRRKRLTETDVCHMSWGINLTSRCFVSKKRWGRFIFYEGWGWAEVELVRSTKLVSGHYYCVRGERRKTKAFNLKSRYLPIISSCLIFANISRYLSIFGSWVHCVKD